MSDTTPRPRRRRPPGRPTPAVAVAAPTLTELEAALQFQMRAARLPEPVWQFRWHPQRMYRADAAYPARRLLIEVEGGVTPYRDKRTGELRQGRHSTVTGYENDCIKYSEAAILGWRVVRVTRRMVDDGRALALIERALALLTTVGAA